VSLFVLSPEIEDRDEDEVASWAKHKKTFYRLQKKDTSTVSIEIHKGAIFYLQKETFLSTILQNHSVEVVTKGV
jgi:acyl-CoA thioesterase